MKKTMILADTDERYLKELSYYFMENTPQLELITFTRKEKLMNYLGQGNTADILVVDEQLAEHELKERTPNMTRIAMSVSMSSLDGFVCIKKYQRMENLTQAILLSYAEENGSLETVKGSSNTKIAVFFHPAGGTGKTALSLALAAAGAKAGLRTLYLNLEDIDSVYDSLERTNGNLSDVFLALKTKGMNPGIKVKGSAMREPSAGFYYISGVESISEYEEISDDEVRKLLNAVQELADYDLVVVDQGSGFTGRTKEVLNEADIIFVPVTPEEGNTVKLQRLLQESRLHGEYDPLFRKMYVLFNKVNADGHGIPQLPEVIRTQLPFCASIPVSGILAKKKNILVSGEQMLQIMGPLLQIIEGTYRNKTD